MTNLDRLIAKFGMVEAAYRIHKAVPCQICAYKHPCTGDTCNADRCDKGVRKWLEAESE